MAADSRSPVLRPGSFLLLLCLALPGVSLAQPAPPPDVCAEDEAFRAFDFWLGHWQVTNRATGQVAGRNRIVAVERGCAIQENWTSRRGTTGMSLNWYDPTRDRWRQVWISAPGYVIDIEGVLRDGSMVLEGHITTYGDGTTHDFRGTWTANNDGTVRQLFEQYSETDDDWQVWFDGLYTPITAEEMESSWD